VQIRVTNDRLRAFSLKDMPEWCKDDTTSTRAEESDDEFKCSMRRSRGLLAILVVGAAGSPHNVNEHAGRWLRVADDGDTQKITESDRARKFCTV
jgi:hypothetical protein